MFINGNYNYDLIFLYIRVEEAALQKLQGTNEDTNKDQIVNAVFQTIVGEQSGYCRGLGAGIQLTLVDLLRVYMKS